MVWLFSGITQLAHFMAAHEKQFSWTTRYNPAVSFCVLRVCSTQDGVRPKGVYAHKTFLFRYVWMRTRETRMLVIFGVKKLGPPLEKFWVAPWAFIKTTLFWLAFVIPLCLVWRHSFEKHCTCCPSKNLGKERTQQPKLQPVAGCKCLSGVPH